MITELCEFRFPAVSGRLRGSGAVELRWESCFFFFFFPDLGDLRVQDFGSEPRIPLGMGLGFRVSEIFFLTSGLSWGCPQTRNFKP